MLEQGALGFDDRRDPADSHWPPRVEAQEKDTDAEKKDDSAPGASDAVIYPVKGIIDSGRADIILPSYDYHPSRQSMAPLLVGRTLDSFTSDMGAFWRHVTGDSQLRWIGPDKGALHLAAAAVINAV